MPLSELTIAQFKTRVRCVVGMLLMAVVGISAWSIVSERKDVITAAERQAEGYARALAEHSESAFAESDRVLRDVLDDIRKEGGAERIDRHELFNVLQRQAGDSPQIGALFIVDKSGSMFINSMQFPSNPINVADRDYFRHYLTTPGADLTLCRPVMSRLVKRWRFNLMRPLNRPEDTFTGLAAVAFEVEYFRRFFTSASLGPRGRIALIHNDGAPLVYEPHVENIYESDFRKSVLFRKKLPASPSGTFHVDQSVVDKSPRIISYQRLSRFPVVALISLNRDDILAPWVRKAAQQSSLTLGLCLSVVFLMQLLTRHLDRLQTTQNSLLEHIRERRQSELRERTRLQILEGMATGTDLQRLLENIVLFVEQERQGSFCSVLLADELGKHLRHGAAPSLPDSYNRAVDGLRIAEGMGSCGTAAHLRQRVIVEDIEGHPYWKGFKPVREAGLRSCWSEPVISSDGELLGTFAIYYREPRSPDQNEIQLIDSAAHLAGIAIERFRSEERRSKLEIQLHHVQKIEAIGQLAGGIAHDFNNLLTPIIVYADMIRRKLSAEDPLADKAQGIITAAHKARDLTQQLLSFGRKQLLTMQSVDLNEIVTSFQDILRRTIRENIDIDIRLAPGGTRIWADRGQVEQILLNLVVNAQDAIAGNGTIVMETGHVVLDDEYARLHPGMQPGSYALLVFRDNGCGMDDETLGHIFEPFFTTKPVGHGTGLGLATVYGIVKQHEGYIRAESRVGEGTIFNIYLPLSKVAVTAVADAVPPRSADGASGGDMNILFVEDNEMIRTMAVELLESSGYGVFAADHPVTAFQLVKEHGNRIDLLVTDVVMPGMNGQELHERLCMQLPGLKVLYISGYTNELFLNNRLLEEEINFMQKPFTAERFLDRIRQMLG